MPTTRLGRATYSAHRHAGVTTLVADGQTPNFNDTVGFVPSPLPVEPPSWQFEVTSQDISLPAFKVFHHEQAIEFPASATAVEIVDADGKRLVAITEIQDPPPAASGGA